MTNKPPEMIQASPQAVFLPARLASIVNVSLSLCPDAINGVLLGPTRDRVLLTGQTAPAENGIYTPQESGVSTDRNIAASASTTESATAARLVWVSVTGTVTVTGANGAVTAGNPGFLAPLSGPTRFDVTGGSAGGVASFKTSVALVRAADADANGDFGAGKTCYVQAGTNSGVWQMPGPVSPVIISNSLAIAFSRTVEGNPSRAAFGAAMTSEAPGIIPFGLAFAIATSLGTLASTSGALHALI